MVLAQGIGALKYWWHNQVSGKVCLQQDRAEYSAAEVIPCFAVDFLPSPFLLWLPSLGVLLKSWGFQPVSWPLQTKVVPALLKTACAPSSSSPSSLGWIPASSLSSSAYSACLALPSSPALEHTEPDPRSAVGNAGGAIVGCIKPRLVLRGRSGCFQLLSTFSTGSFVPAVLKRPHFKL